MSWSYLNLSLRFYNIQETSEDMGTPLAAYRYSKLLFRIGEVNQMILTTHCYLLDLTDVTLAVETSKSNCQKLNFS